MSSTEWHLRALCRGHEDPDLWFPAGYQSEPHKAQIRKARTFCADCPVQALCLRQAMDAEGDKTAENRTGIWGGTTPRMRAELRQELARRAEARLAA